MLRRIVDLREGEGRVLASTSAILALLTGAHTILETARDTLFLSKLPPSRLAWVYVLLAVLSLFAGALSSAMSKRFGRRAGFVATLGICAYAVVLLYLREPTPPTVFVLYVATGVIGTILTLQFWLFAGQLFTVAQGKRLFGPMAAGGVAGATLGATTAALLLRSITPTSLLLASAGMFLVAGVVVTAIPAAEGIDAEDRSPTRAFSGLTDIELLRSDRYVALVGGLVAIATATVLLADYLFKSSAARMLGPDKLGMFLGVFYAVQNAVALVVQVFIAGPLVRRLGVTTTLLVFPVLLLTGGVGVVITGAFAMTLALKGTDGSLRHSLHRVTTELLLLPLPVETRDRAKRLIETLIGRGAQAVAAASIVALSMFGLGDAQTLGIIIAGLSLAWVGTAIAIRSPYLDVFRRALARGELPDGTHELDLSSVETIMESLASTDEAQVIAAIDLLATTKRRRLLPALILYHESPIVLERALDVFANEPRRDFQPLAERLLGHPEAGVRAEAVRALAAAGRREAAEMALDDSDPKVRAYAAFFLAVEAPDPHTDARIVAMIGDTTSEGSQLRRALLDVIGEHGDDRWSDVVVDVVHREPGRRPLGPSAASAIQRTRTTSLASYVVEHLAIREGRSQYRTALVSLGTAGFDALRDAFADPSVPERLQRQLPRAVAAFGTQEAVDLLSERLDAETSDSLRYRILRALGRLSTDARNGVVGRLKFDRKRFERHAELQLTEYLRLFELTLAIERKVPPSPVADSAPRPASPERASSYPRAEGDSPVADVLVGLLRDRIATELEISFRFLQLAHRNEDIESVHYAVVRGDKRARATALEFLDLLTIDEALVRSLLRVVVDELDPQERVRRSKEIIETERAALAPIGHDEAVKRLIRNDDPLLAALAAAYATEAGLPELVTLARQEVERRPELMRLGRERFVPRLELSHA
ncbi:MAG: MFS transporter [Polyangiaceae bacterium]|nr:MFS transporter [Polyangiaceae bacterium]